MIHKSKLGLSDLISLRLLDTSDEDNIWTIDNGDIHLSEGSGLNTYCGKNSKGYEPVPPGKSPKLSVLMGLCLF